MAIGVAPLGGYADTVLLVIRLIMGAAFLYFGWPKIQDLKENAEDFNHMGFKPGWIFGTGVAFVEFFGALMLILGVLTWLAAGALAIHMLIGAVWKITSTDKPFTDWSYDLLMFGLCLALLAFGPGSIALL